MGSVVIYDATVQIDLILMLIELNLSLYETGRASGRES